MTAQEFNQYWELTYPETIPVSHYFKHDYTERWLRIHSLPLAKRGPGNNKEWKILLDRQNTLITDLIGENGTFYLVLNEYCHEEQTGPMEKEEAYEKYQFTPLGRNDQEPDEEEGFVYKQEFSEQKWASGRFNDILKDIAEDNSRAFFMSIAGECIIAPYDGGMDIIVKDTDTRDRLKYKYKAWLSERGDGL